jgi:hypothetical protein
VGAAIGYAVFYAIVQAFVPGSSHSSIAVSMAFTLLLSAAYLRTQALWVSWGLNFAWKASRALLFGLAISGDYSHSPVVEGNPMGPFWITGGGYGLDGSWVAFLVLLAALPVIFRLTRELDYQYNLPPEVVPAGTPLNVVVRSTQTVVTGTGAPSLVQILPTATPPPAGAKPPSAGRPPTAG